MRQFSPFQKVTKIPLLFSAQMHSVPPQTTSRAGSPVLRTDAREKPGHNANIVSLTRASGRRRGGLLRYCFPFPVMFGTAGRAALSELKSMEYQSKIFWKPINSSLKVGLAQHSSTPFPGAGWGAADAGLDLSQMPQARAASQPAQGGKEHPASASRTAGQVCRCRAWPGATARKGRRQSHIRGAGRAATSPHGHCTCSERQHSTCGCCRRGLWGRQKSRVLRENTCQPKAGACTRCKNYRNAMLWLHNLKKSQGTQKSVLTLRIRQ